MGIGLMQLRPVTVLVVIAQLGPSAGSDAFWTSPTAVGNPLPISRTAAADEIRCPDGERKSDGYRGRRHSLCDHRCRRSDHSFGGDLRGNLGARSLPEP